MLRYALAIVVLSSLHSAFAQDVAGESPKWTLRRPEALRRIAYLPDGKRLLSAGEDGKVLLWDIAAQKVLREFVVRGRGYLKGVPDLRSIVLKNDGGTPALLQDVARVELGPDERRGLTELNGEGEVTSGIVLQRFGANALDVIDSVKRRIAEIAGSLPKGVEIQPVYDRSTLIHAAIANLRRTLLEESLHGLRGLGEKWFLSRSIETLAEVMASTGEHERAAHLFGAAETLREAVGASVLAFYRADYDRAIDMYREIHQRFPTSEKASYAHWKCAWLTYRQNRPEEAKKYFEEQVEFYPGSN